MTVNWQGVSPVITTLFNANNAINFASTVNNEGVHSIIERASPEDTIAVTSLYNEATASRFGLTKFKWD